MKKIVYLLLGTASIIAFPYNNVQAQIISTVAGTGAAGYSGDSMAATAAKLYAPAGVALDATGNLYIADQYNNCVRKVDATTGDITTIAGNDTAGYNSDSIAATAARLNNPTGIAIDAQGNVYIADQLNNRIRKVNAITGMITTVAGTGVTGFSGDNGAATAAKLYSPRGVAVDLKGNLYIADRVNHRIRKVNDSGIISTLAGTGAEGYNGDSWPTATMASLDFPAGVAVDSIGNVYIADQFNNRIRKVDTSGKISTATSVLTHPYAVAVDNYGNIYGTDGSNYLVKKITPANLFVTIAGTGTSGYNGDSIVATSAKLGDPQGIAVNATTGVVYIADWSNNRVRQLTSVLAVETAAGKSATTLQVYPNPASNGTFTVNIATATTQENATITVTNITGQKVAETITPTNKPAVIRLNQPDGLYFVTATTTSGKISTKVQVLSN